MNYVIQYGDFAGTELPFNDPFLRAWASVTGEQLGGTRGPKESAHINLLPVWEEYGGDGIWIGTQESIGYPHYELAANYLAAHTSDTGREYDPIPTQRNYHGTAVAGVISAEANNGIGNAGIAYEAQITSHSGFGLGGSLATNNFYSRYDIVTNSAGGAGTFFAGTSSANFDKANTQYDLMSVNGRDGLGTVVFNSAGNNDGRDASLETTARVVNKYVMAIGKLNGEGIAASSSFGSALHISAPLNSATGTESLLTLDQVGELGGVQSDEDFVTRYLDGTGLTLADIGGAVEDFVRLGGTSTSTPVTAASTALVLEAAEKNNIYGNGLGWRDVQEILALSARYTQQGTDPYRGPNVGSLQDAGPWTVNDAVNYNGFGLTFQPNVGFGMLDVRAAVRLAETWSQTAITGNMVTVSQSVQPDGEQIGTGVTYQFSITEDVEIDFVELAVDLTHSDVRELEIDIISPNSGIVSTVWDTPKLTAGLVRETSRGFTDEAMFFPLLSRAFWGESSVGTWTVTVRDTVDNDVNGTVNSFDLRLIGDTANEDDTFFFTDDAAVTRDIHRHQTGAAQVQVPVLNDGAGRNALNFAAMTSGVIADLDSGATEIATGLQLFTAGAGLAIETVIGTDKADSLTGDNAANIIHGRQGDDLLTGEGGDDELVGHTGDDTLLGGDGDDMLDPGAGTNSVDGGSGSDTVRLDGNASAYDIAYMGDEAILTGAGTLTVATNVEFAAFDDQTVELARPSVITGTEAGDSLSGTEGDDTILGLGLNDRLYGRGGDDLLDGGENNDRLYGGTGDDTLLGGNGNDRLEGGLGADRLDGGAGRDFADYIRSVTGVTVNLATGVVSGDEAAGDVLISIEDLRGSKRDDVLTGTDADNRMYGHRGVDIISGGGGRDLLYAGDQDDTVYGGAGDDRVYGSRNNDLLDGGEGRDLIYGQDHDDILLGRDGDDLLDGGTGNDDLSGGDGDDTLLPGTGTDTADGGAGEDTVRIAGNSADFTWSFDGTLVVTGASVALTATNVEFIAFDDVTEELAITAQTITGTDARDTLNGTDGNDIIDALGGSDLIYDGAGSDTAFGGSGSDRFYAGSGADAYFGGSSYDVIDFRNADSGVGVNLTSGNGFAGDAAGDSYDSVEYLYGSNFNDDLTGDGGRNIILGRNGDDLIEAGAGNDFVYSGNGDDVMFGGDGRDTLRGSRGDDTMTGGAGTDFFWVYSTTDLDVITDFTIGEDILRLNATGQSGFAEIQPLLSQVGADTRIDLSSSSVVVLEGIQASDLSASDFMF